MIVLDSKFGRSKNIKNYTIIYYVRCVALILNRQNRQLVLIDIDLFNQRDLLSAIVMVVSHLRPTIKL